MIIGIDPGITGAIAFVESGTVVKVHDMPTVTKVSGKGLQVNPHQLARLLAVSMPDRAIVEAVGPMPKQGVTSVFSFGKSAGIIEGILAAYNIPYEMVTPQKWKRNLGLTGKDKDAARALCIREHPEIADQLTRKRDIGRADAILIAMYAYK